MIIQYITFQLFASSVQSLSRQTITFKFSLHLCNQWHREVDSRHCNDDRLHLEVLILRIESMKSNVETSFIICTYDYVGNMPTVIEISRAENEYAFMSFKSLHGSKGTRYAHFNVSH